MKPFDDDRLRGALEYALRFDVQHVGSLYLRVLACVYLSAPDGAEPALERLFYNQAEQTENIDPDQLLNTLLLVAGGAS